MAFVSVAVPVPFLGALTYRAADDLAPARGARVLVPLGTRQVTGCVLGPAEPPDADAEVRDILRVLDDDPLVPGHVVDLALWVAEYYASGPGEAIAAAMPPRAWIETDRLVAATADARARLAADPGAFSPHVAALLRTLAHGQPVSRRTLESTSPNPDALDRTIRSMLRDGLLQTVHAEAGRVHAFKTLRRAALTAQGLDIVERIAAGEATPAAARLTDSQVAALTSLRGLPEGATTATLRGRGIGPDTLRRLAAKGLVAFREERVERDPFSTVYANGQEGDPGSAPRTSAESQPGHRPLTPQQQAALETLGNLEPGRFAVALLHGVTGSGKTEVYLRAAARTLSLGRRVLVLVPEIALTPAVAAVFRQAFGQRVAIQHSGLSDGERHDQWHRIREGHVDIVVGTRSAVFSPLEGVGLIIVDEEHDGSYKQEESPRYNGRDVAIVRGRAANALVLLGSATPSMESYRNALDGRYQLIRMPDRVLDRPLASVQLVNMRDELAAAGEDVVLSAALIDAMQTRLGRGEQALLLLNRRGLARAVFCRQCGATFDCPNCSVSLTVHHGARGPARGRCHYCNFSAPVPKACTMCAGPYLEHIGFGTERVEQEVVRRFPGARVARVDRDTMRRRGAIQQVLHRFGRGELDVIVGTQMIAKGHDFPAVTLVGVISADVGLGVPDFRSAERTFQLLTQVAGRAGRGALPGQAIVQTLFPEHYSIQLACRQDYGAFYEKESLFRRAMRYPPAVALVNVVVRGRNFGDSLDSAADIAMRIRTLTHGTDVRVLGPAPAPLGKLRGEYRTQLLIKGSNRPAMREAVVAAVAASPDLQRRTTIDVDPLSMM